MKTINKFIIERLKLNKDTKIQSYRFFPNSFSKLKELLKKLLNERGKDADLNDVDVSEVDTFYDENNEEGLFEYLDPHNIKIDKWDVSKVTNMAYAFYGCKKFNCDLSDWQVNRVKNMMCMFSGCERFKGEGLENWKPESIGYNTDSMFTGCSLIDLYKKYPSWYKK